MGAHRVTPDDDKDINQTLDNDYQMTADRFRSLDHNGDGRLTASEWHGDPIAFRGYPEGYGRRLNVLP